jgi:hypothetical protein
LPSAHGGPDGIVEAEDLAVVLGGVSGILLQQSWFCHTLLTNRNG